MASLLLRLFKSEFFSPELALTYLKRHSDSIGITHYLTQQLRTAFPREEVEFYWPQLCHLLVAQPSESKALENFILERCEESVHVALLTLWYLQATLSDLSINPHTASFLVCSRVFNKVQTILFDDTIALRPSISATGSQQSPELVPRLPTGKINPANVSSLFVGLGTMLAATPAMPCLGNEAGGVAVAQGKRKPLGSIVDRDAVAKGAVSDGVERGAGEVERGGNLAAMQRRQYHSRTESLDDRAAEASSSEGDAYESEEEGDAGWSRRASKQNSPTIPTTRTARTTRPRSMSKTNSHVVRTRARNVSTPTTAAQSRSVPNLVVSRSSTSFPSPFASSHALPSRAMLPPDVLLSRYDVEGRTRLLRTNYCKQQTQFLLDLQDISTRLIALPKPARLSALRAELTLLNNKLPAEVCVPLWCTADTPIDTVSDDPRDTDSSALPFRKQRRPGARLRHHRVVRINPADAVVLNSADRAPYLMHVEVLTDELDFDPERRENMEILKTLVVKEEARRRRAAGFSVPISGSGTRSGKQVPAEKQRRKAAAEASASERTQSSKATEEVLQRGEDSLSSEPGLMETPEGLEEEDIVNVGPQASASSELFVPVGDIRDPTPSRSNLASSALGHQMRANGVTQSRPGQQGLEDETVLKDDPSAAVFRESWAAKRERIRTASPFGHLASWDVISVIVKTGADLRQEQLAVQLINEFAKIWKETGTQCWVRYFRILVTSESSGLMETITDAVSIHSIKKEGYARHVDDRNFYTYSLYDHFVNTFGDPSSAKFNRARNNLIRSLAGYSIVCYLLQIKDRHNGNILVDNEGHLIHIDFGFMLGLSPGGVGFEMAPFKLSSEYIDILGGFESVKYRQFKELVKSGFRDVRKNAERIIMLVELMQKDSKLPCFALGDLTSQALRDRFQLSLSAAQADDFMERLIVSAAGSAFTRLYDSYQYYSQGIL